MLSFEVVSHVRGDFLQRPRSQFLGRTELTARFVQRPATRVERKLKSVDISESWFSAAILSIHRADSVRRATLTNDVFETDPCPLSPSSRFHFPSKRSEPRRRIPTAVQQLSKASDLRSLFSDRVSVRGRDEEVKRGRAKPSTTHVLQRADNDPDTGAGKWTDDQLVRAIREGTGHDGRALFPMMPYPNFRYLTNEALASIIVDLRSLPPVRHELPKTEIVFPVNYLIRAVPQPVTQPVTGGANSPDPVKRGAYLVRIGGCADCHTPRKGPTAVPGMDFAGGATAAGPWGSRASQRQYHSRCIGNWLL